MSERFGKPFTDLLLDASGEATVSAFAIARGFPKATLCRWVSPLGGEPRRGRREPLLIAVLESIGIPREKQGEVIDRLFGSDWGHVGGRARAARAKSPAGVPISPFDQPPTASPEDPEQPSAKITDIRPLVIQAKRVTHLLQAALTSPTLDGDARFLVTSALKAVIAGQKKNWFSGFSA